MISYDSKVGKKYIFAMAGLEPAILDFGRPMPYPFGHMALMLTSLVELDSEVLRDMYYFFSGVFSTKIQFLLLKTPHVLQ